MTSNYSLLFLFNALLLLPFLSCAQLAVKGAYWFPDSGLAMSSIDSTLFTHLFFAFAGMNPSTYQVVISQADQPYASQFTITVQQKNPSVKTILSIGDGGSNATVFASMASSSTNRKSFISSSINLARSYNYSGLDLDWEYPQSQTDMTNLGSLLTEWRSAVSAESKSSGEPPLSLTAAVYFYPTVNSLNYPTSSIASNLDWINLMAYDFYSPAWSDPETQPHAALYDPTGQVSGSIGVAGWINAGLSAKNIALGMPFYGYAWKLKDPDNHGYFAPTTGAAVTQDGSMSYNQIISFISQNGATKVYNSTTVEDYCYSGTTWITYDDTQSISTKVSYAKQKGLLGYFAWHVGADDSSFTLSKTAFTT
ncbi:hypothetical protein Ancab_006741 [Ancistrocladus abbreviatus]